MTHIIRIVSARAGSACATRSSAWVAIAPERANSAKATPVATATAPGRMKAARQLTRSVSAPAISAAAATPRLPNRPLTPIALPRRAAWRTTQAVPTGW